MIVNRHSAQRVQRVPVTAQDFGLCWLMLTLRVSGGSVQWAMLLINGETCERLLGFDAYNALQCLCDAVQCWTLRSLASPPETQRGAL